MLLRQYQVQDLASISKTTRLVLLERDFLTSGHAFYTKKHDRDSEPKEEQKMTVLRFFAQEPLIDCPG